MDDAPDLPFKFARHAQHAATVTEALHRVAQVARPPVLLDDAAKGLLHLPLLAADEATDTGQLVGGVGTDRTLRINNRLDGRRKFGDVVDLADHCVEVFVLRLPGSSLEEGKELLGLQQQDVNLGQPTFDEYVSLHPEGL